ncbi:MAG: 1-acyl-sn-glycerol-3-phosphate acyltransferase [Termitinemataceae bacterium]|nr:MAG: 1-acyl-sn-glycerol-3-phosphate acyltransferase [Termitinemataceae bacterium]
METFSKHFKDAIRESIAAANAPHRITGDDVYQEANETVLNIIDTKITEDLLLPQSECIGIENINELYKRSHDGAACLLLCEHFSNMDLPLISYLIRKAGGTEAAKSLLTIAGMKLNEEDDGMAAFAAGFRRIVICPSKHIQSVDPLKDKDEYLRLIGINRSAMKKLDEEKHNGKIVLLFPTATRYRPWDPLTRRVARDIDSYVKGFDFMCFVALNGEVMHIQQGNMLEDTISKDIVYLTISPIINCAEFRTVIRNACADDADKKQAVADKISDSLIELHNIAEPSRQKKLDKLS